MLFRDSTQPLCEQERRWISSLPRRAGEIAFLLAFALLPTAIQAAVITVTGTGDTTAVDGVVTLREAITSANINANVNADVIASGAYGNDTINFNIPGAG